MPKTKLEVSEPKPAGTDCMLQYNPPVPDFSPAIAPEGVRLILQSDPSVSKVVVETIYGASRVYVRQR